MSAALHRHTPALVVADPRGRPVRQVRFCRSEVGGVAEARIDAQHFDCAGRPIASWDARLHAQRLAGGDPPANLRATFTLSGTPLLTDGVDAGWRVALFSEAEAVVEEWDSRGSRWETEYDALLRPEAMVEQAPGQPARTAQRIEYADAGAASAARNRCGLPYLQCDDAGRLAIEDYGLLGQPLRERRQFLSTLDAPDWPATGSAQDALLESGDGAPTSYEHDASGALLMQQDAQGHRRHFTFGVSGQLQGVDLTLAGGTAQVVLREVRYNALGQALTQTAGNGVIGTRQYDEADGRLTALRSTRPGKGTLQHLEYQHDPVGNILSIRDDAQPTRHFANQRVEPVNSYSYDSLYQLLSATGRETASATVGPVLPELAGLPLDDSQLTHYTQRYRYDAGGNLVELRHEGRQGYTRRMHVAAHSNRALPIIDGQPAPNPLTGFDINGNLLALAPGQALQWDARNQLQRITTVTRTEGDHDDERYMYDSQGARLRKVTRGKAKATQHERDVRYLPGLELRSDSANDEHLEVVVVQAGLCTVRCLHWITGKPDGIANGQLRYSLGDHLGSVSMELDGNAELISQEGYYPYGGTAWWAARSAVEARYKTVRYSGKEREASGLYYYGLRYYAPWLKRWINPDPLGPVDGLNMYGMVRNNPVSFRDESGGITLDNQTLSVSVAAVAILAVIIWQLLRREISSPTEQDVKTEKVNQRLKELKKTIHFSVDEVISLKDWMAKLLLPEYVEIGITPQGGRYAYDLSRKRHRELYDPSAENPQDVALLHRIPFLALDQPDDDIAISVSRRESVDAITVSSASSTFSIASSGVNQLQSRSQKKRRGIGKSSDDQRTTKPSTSSSSSHRVLEVDVSNFFDKNDYYKNLGKKKRESEEVKESIMGALNRYAKFREGNAHTSAGGELSLDLHGLGGTGRGDFRLFVRRVGQKLEPIATHTHKTMNR